MAESRGEALGGQVYGSGRGSSGTGEVYRSARRSSYVAWGIAMWLTGGFDLVGLGAMVRDARGAWQTTIGLILLGLFVILALIRARQAWQRFRVWHQLSVRHYLHVSGIWITLVNVVMVALGLWLGRLYFGHFTAWRSFALQSAFWFAAAVATTSLMARLVLVPPRSRPKRQLRHDE